MTEKMYVYFRYKVENENIHIFIYKDHFLIGPKSCYFML